MGKILLIDDAQFARMVLRTMLEDRGYEICGEAENGREGIEKFKQLKPDLVLCDIRMNEMDGRDCLRAIMSENPNANVVICAAISDKSCVGEFLEAGAKGYIEKPICAEELYRMTEKLIGKPKGDRSCKELMEEYAKAEGIARKPLLDFFAAFQSINGFPLDDPRVDRQYLKDNGEGLLIGIRALLSAKITLEQSHQVERIFHKLTAGA